MMTSEPPIPSATAGFPVASHQVASSASASTSAAGGAVPLATPPELEQTLALLSAHRTVLGYLLLSRTQPVRIIRHSGVVFEGEQGRRYARAVGRIVDAVQGGLEDIAAGNTDGDEVRFMRIRTRRHELMISPDERYLLVVLHDPTS